LALKHFLKVFQSGDAAGWIAEKDGCVVGFLVYTVTAPPTGSENGSGATTWRQGATKNVVTTTAPCVNLLNIVIGPEWRRQGIGRSMLEILNQGLWRTARSVQILVPETNLTLQLFLRAVGYKATRVVRDGFETEDAYLMERQPR
jgi:ribosomal protein S18 acetylase RimI-like enzyme